MEPFRNSSIAKLVWEIIGIFLLLTSRVCWEAQYTCYPMILMSKKLGKKYITRESKHHVFMQLEH